MAKDFISDEEMNSLEASRAPDFISDQEMEKIEPKSSFGKRVAKGMIDVLPTAGAMFGGAAGLASPLPGGTIIGTGTGAALGESLKGALNTKFFPEDAPKSLKEALLKDVQTGGEFAAAEGSAMGLGKGLKALSQTKPVQQAGKFVAEKASKAGEAIKEGVTKLVSSTTGISEQSIKTFAKDTKGVNKLIKDTKGDMTEAADMVRRNIRARLDSQRQNLGKQIGDAIKKSSKDKTIDVSGVSKALDDHMGRLDKVLDKAEITQITDIKKMVSEFAQGGKTNLDGLNKLKRKLQDIAKPAFNEVPVFPAGKQAQQASKTASGVAKDILDTLSPEIKAANQKLSQIHRVEKISNKNLFTEGRPEAAMMAAGKGANPRNAAILRRIGKLTDSNPLKEAEILAAAKEFSDASAFSKIPTGRALMGTVTGGAVGGAPGAAVGAILSSPIALKKAIELGAVTANMIRGPKKVTAEVAETIIKNLGKTEAGQKLIQEAEEQISNVMPIKKGSAIERRLAN